MLIAVNTRLLLKNKLEGIGWFAYETLKRIVEKHPEHRFLFIFDRPPHPDFIFGDNVEAVVIAPQARHPILWYLWFQFSVKRVLRKYKPDVFLSPDGYLPLPCKTKSVAVIHDIAFEHYPETVPGLAGWYYRYFYPRFAAAATRIATVSEYSKADIAKTYNIPIAKIDVVYNGYNTQLHPVDETTKTQTKKQYTAGQEYFVFVGGLYPRKNIQRLITAFEIFKAKHNTQHKLVLIGKQVFETEKLIQQKEESAYKDDIIFTGRVDDAATFNALIASAVAMTYVSIFEGFGIPCLEGMQCGIPIITSNTSSMPEVCADAAFYVNPFEPNSIAEGMATVALNPNLQQELIQKANARLQEFSWDKSADLLWQVVERVKSE
ncbi:MAG: glycosyltransferase family 1 protein [Bacteroidetes bacterium]|nr:glycosyltransferase family 1 protein [Bacteroidota bacterium]